VHVRHRPERREAPTIAAAVTSALSVRKGAEACRLSHGPEGGTSSFLLSTRDREPATAGVSMGTPLLL